SVEAGGCLDHYARYEDQYRRSALESKGARKELDSVEWRCFRYFRELHRVFVCNKQFPRLRRDLEPRCTGWKPDGQRDIRLHRALSVREANPGRLHRLLPALRV